jgi:hypothetical protein
MTTMVGWSFFVKYQCQVCPYQAFSSFVFVIMFLNVMVGSLFSSKGGLPILVCLSGCFWQFDFSVPRRLGFWPWQQVIQSAMTTSFMRGCFFIQALVFYRLHFFMNCILQPFLSCNEIDIHPFCDVCFYLNGNDYK